MGSLLLLRQTGLRQKDDRRHWCAGRSVVQVHARGERVGIGYHGNKKGSTSVHAATEALLLIGIADSPHVKSRALSFDGFSPGLAFQAYPCLHTSQLMAIASAVCWQMEMGHSLGTRH